MKKFISLLFLSITFISSVYSAEINLKNTIFEKAADKFNLDPVLLYSVALAESAMAMETKSGNVGPWPWTLRNKDYPFYASTKEEAEIKLKEFITQYGNSIDIGIMQINLKWNKNKISTAEELLDIEKNVMLGAEILSDSIKSSPNDLALGIGRYHIWVDEDKARNYGYRVLTIYRNINRL